MGKEVYSEEDYPEIAFLCARIKQAREEKKWTQRDFAEALGVSPGQIGHLETQKQNVTLASLKAIARVLEKPMRFFVYDESEARGGSAVEAAIPATPAGEGANPTPPKPRKRIVLRGKGRG
jgi:transcriptional regulator with XRE-family HTH domain